MRALTFSIDDAYVIPFKVLWHSLIKTESIPDNTKIFILHEDTLTLPSISDLTEYILRSGLNVAFVDASSRVPDDLPIQDNDHVSKATFYRLYVATILPKEITSIVYLDSDAIVMRSIRYLFEIELNYPIAAVDHLSPQNALRLWGDVSGSYFQAGVLIIDLNAWRSANYEFEFGKILKDYKNKIKWWDQCVLNIAFQNNWQRLPIWFNVCSSVRQMVDSKMVEEECRFMHFDGSIKPWKNNSNTAQALSWYKIYEEVFESPIKFKRIKTSLSRRIWSKAKKLLKCKFSIK